MTRTRMMSVLALALLVGSSGCDLEVSNTNQPDRARALATPDDVEALISSAYQEIWSMQHYWNANLATNHMSSRHTASWGNMGQNDFGRQPREPMPNQSSYFWSYIFEGNWQDSYSAISAASDGIRAINEGLEIGPGGERNQRALTFASFSQAMALCYLGLWFDKAFLVDEATDLTGELGFSPYTDLIDAGLDKLDATIAMARSGSFMLEDNWINGNPLSNNELADLMVSYKARCRANAPRSDAEAASVDWNAVRTDATNGLQELTIVGTDGDFFGTPSAPWWDGPKALGTEPTVWHRMHVDWHGMSDVTGEYQRWLQTPLAERMPIRTLTPDQRYPSVNEEEAQGSLHRFYNSIIWPPVRGTYRQSHYADYRHEEYLLSCSFCPFGDISEVIPEEMKLYIAEAAFRTGDVATTVSIVNETRVGVGGLPPVVDAGTVPGGDQCVPRKRYDPMGRCGDLRDALIYEHFESIFQISGGLEYWHGRRFDILPSGTAVHMPVPASDLEVLQESIYTFGGVGNPSSAGDPTPPNIVPGSLNTALERAAWSLDRLRARAKTKHSIRDFVVR